MDYRRVEHELLVLLARTGLETTFRRTERLMNEDIDWNYLFEIAFDHGVYPLVYVNAKRCGLQNAGATADDVRRFESIYEKNSIRNKALTFELLEVLRILQANQIPVIPLKGPLLTHMIYGDLAMRMFSDLDVLVPPNLFDSALSLLIEAGFVLVDKDSTPSKANHKAQKHCTLTKHSRIILELHWSLDSLNLSAHENTNCFWNSAQPYSWFGVSIMLSSNEEMLLYLCRHGSKHLWFRLKWLCDIAVFLQRNTALNWPYIMARAADTRTRRLLLLGLYLTDQLFDSVIPQDVRDEIAKEKSVAKLAAEISDHMFASPTVKDSAEQLLDEQILLSLLRDTTFRRLRYLVGVAMSRKRLEPSEKDRSLLGLPPFLSFLYYGVRPVRLLLLYGRALLRRFSR